MYKFRGPTGHNLGVTSIASVMERDHPYPSKKGLPGGVGWKGKIGEKYPQALVDHIAVRDGQPLQEQKHAERVAITNIMTGYHDRGGGK